METNHATYLKQAIQLAQRGAGWVGTNPMVGAVLVHHGKVIATGYHAQFGGAHAERRLLQTAQKKYSKIILRQSTLYVTLEPCSNLHKKTPPCLPLVLASGIKHIVIGSIDPNPNERGRSIKQLRRSGIQITVGVCKTECDYLIRTFCKWITQRQPYVLAKTALSLDGKITAPDQKYLSNSTALRRVHELRQEFSAIAVGANTIIQDQPSLTTRLAGKKHLHQPVKVIFDAHLITPATSKILDQHTIIFYHNPSHPLSRYQKTGATLVQVKNVREALRVLAERNISSLLVEGGAGLLTSFINQRAIDEFYLLYSPQIFGASQLSYCGEINNRVTLSALTLESLGDNFLIRGYATYEYYSQS